MPPRICGKSKASFPAIRVFRKPSLYLALEASDERCGVSELVRRAGEARNCGHQTDEFTQGQGRCFRTAALPVQQTHPMLESGVEAAIAKRHDEAQRRSVLDRAGGHRCHARPDHHRSRMTRGHPIPRSTSFTLADVLGQSLKPLA